MSNDYRCRDCNCVFDVDDKLPRLQQKCPDCGSERWGLMPQVSNIAVKGDPYDWSNEHGGKGRRISQLDYGVNKPYYAKSQREALNEASRRGLHAYKA